jgi:hypothetical protein
MQRLVFAVPVAALLICAVLGGLVRAGGLPGFAGAVPLGNAALHHAALMIGSFMGTVIAIERCVALKRRAAWLAPLTSALAGAALLSGRMVAGALLLCLASAIFVAMNIAIVARHAAWHTALLLAGAGCWFAGNVLYLAGGAAAAVAAWWFAFLAMTIAAERLEMTRLMRSRRGARAMLAAVLGVLVLGAGVSNMAPAAGGALYGAALAGLAGWLLLNDIAWRTVRVHGLSRYMAVCLLGGYGWLAVAGMAWISWSLGGPGRDAALHALGLGFVFSMMMGHAPVILPALARVKVRYGPWFYLPLAALHISLAVRLAGGWADTRAFRLGAQLNAGALVLFIFTLAGAAWAWRRIGHAPARRRLVV